MKLLIPGPTEVRQGCLDELSRPISPHYGNDWVKLYNNVIDKLKIIFNTKNDVIIFSATASAAIESAISSLINTGDKVLICHNGFFSNRIKEIVLSYGGHPILVKSNFNQSVNIMDVKKKLNNHNDIRLLALVHVETSTGVVNNVKEICEIAKNLKILTLIDSVAGLGGTELLVDKWNIDFAISGSQKCLQSPAGLSFLSVSKNAWHHIDNNPRQKGWYLNLKNIRNYQSKWSDWHPQGHNTAPVSLYKSLNYSLEEIIKEGLNDRYIRHKLMKSSVRKSLHLMGLTLYASEKNASQTVTSFILPKYINANDFLTLMRNEHKIILGGDLGYINNQLIRIGHMGISASENSLLPMFIGIYKTLKKLGYNFKNKDCLNTINKTFQ